MRVENDKPLLPLIVFLAVAFAASLTLDLALSTYNIPASSPSSALAYSVWGVARMYSVLLAVVITLSISGRSILAEIKRYIGFSTNAIKHFLLAPLLAYLSLGIYTVITILAGVLDPSRLLELYTLEEVPIPAETLVAITLISGYPAAISVNALAAFGEEVGWRGYMLSFLRSRLGLWKAIPIVGVVWGLWHASAILLLGYNFPCKCLEGVAAYTAFTTSLGALLALLTIATGSILPAASLHGSVNAIWGIAVLSTSAPDTLGGLGVIGASAWAATTIPIALLMHKPHTPALLPGKAT